MAMALNSSSANISWTSPPYNCSFTYVLQIVNEGNVLVVSVSNRSIIVTLLKEGKGYSFSVASMDAEERMSSWSQPVSLTMQGLLLLCNHMTVIE